MAQLAENVGAELMQMNLFSPPPNRSAGQPPRLPDWEAVRGEGAIWLTLTAAFVNELKFEDRFNAITAPEHSAT